MKMSDTSEDLVKDQNNENCHDIVCRDFLRGICERKFCKYKHEHEIKTLNFCHDYQNNACGRPACKFIHCTPQEVEDYKRTGEMSGQILAEATRKNQLPGLLPVCNAFRSGKCRRMYCKYRHITKEVEEIEILDLIKNNANMKNRVQNNMILINETQNTQENGFSVRRVYQPDDVEEFGPTLAKRQFIPNEVECNGIYPSMVNRKNFIGYFAGNPPTILSRTIMLEEENSLLQKEIAQLKKQVSDLVATNEFLLDQNATLRVSSKRNGTVTVPAVTLTNSIPQNNQGQVIRTVAASVATVPVSIATVTTCNPVSIAGCPAVSIAPAAQILAPSQQILVTTNQPTQLALATSSQAQLAIAQQNLANNLAQQGQSQLTSQAQQLALASTTQQLTSQAQHIANQQLALASTPQQISSQAQQMALNNSQQIALANSQQSHLTSQAQQLGQQLTSQAQQLNQQLTSQAQQLALANTTQQLTSQAQQLALANTALANTNQQLTSQAQQLALANTPQQLAVANVPQQLALASANQQILAQQNLASNQQMEMHRNSQMNAINTSQAIAMSHATAPMVSYPIMTHAMPH